MSIYVIGVTESNIYRNVLVSSRSVKKSTWHQLCTSQLQLASNTNHLRLQSQTQWSPLTRRIYCKERQPNSACENASIVVNIRLIYEILKWSVLGSVGI